jgi:hypothetical protein
MELLSLPLFSYTAERQKIFELEGHLKISTSSSTGTLRGPIRLPLGVGTIFTWTSRLPEALTPSKREANNASLQTESND